MKLLPTQFDKSSWHFEQLKRNNIAAIYRRTNIEFPEVIYYETVSIRPQEAMTAIIGGRTIAFEPKEVYPSSEQFGTMAKCCMTRAKAEAYFAKFTQECELQGTIYTG